MTLAPGYQARLKRFDPELRLRWSSRRHVWLLERRARYERLPVDPRRYGFTEHDTIVQQRDGYFALGEYPPGELPTCDRLIAYLRTQDVRRRGDQDLARLAEAVADELDAADAAREEKRRQDALDDVGVRAGDVYETNKWREGVRVAVPRSLPSAAVAR